MTDTAGIWVRVSSDGQNEKTQVPKCLKHCAERGYVVHEPYYVVHGKSAYHGDELDEDWQRVVADVKNHVIDVVVMKMVDRLDRQNILHAIPMVNLVLDNGGRVEFAFQPSTDLTNSAGRRAFAEQCESAFEESRIKSERVLEKFEEIRANGGIIGMGNSSWFDVVPGPNSDERGLLDKKLVPSDEARRLVPGVFERIAAGQSLRKVADWLEDETGRDWWPRTVGLVVKNPAWRGAVCDRAGRFIHKIDDPPVGAKLWKDANDALSRVKPAGAGDGKLVTDKKGRSYTTGSTLLSGLLKCARCDDSPMYRIVTKGGVFYRCTGRGRKRQGCGNMVPLPAADEFVNTEMSRWDWPVTVREFVPGENHEDAIAAVGYEIKGLAALELDDEEDDRRRAELRAERDRLRALPSVSDRWVVVETGVTFAETWERSELPERRAFLRDHKGEFWPVAGKTDSGEHVFGFRYSAAPGTIIRSARRPA